MSKHTPGPWKADSEFGNVVECGNGDIICDYSGGEFDSDTNEANAQFMYKVLGEIVTHIKQGRLKGRGTSLSESVLNKVIAAIAQAEGK